MELPSPSEDCVATLVPLTAEVAKVDGVSAELVVGEGRLATVAEPDKNPTTCVPDDPTLTIAVPVANVTVLMPLVTPAGIVAKTGRDVTADGKLGRAGIDGIPVITPKEFVIVR